MYFMYFRVAHLSVNQEVIGLNIPFLGFAITNLGFTIPFLGFSITNLGR